MTIFVEVRGACLEAPPLLELAASDLSPEVALERSALVVLWGADLIRRILGDWGLCCGVPLALAALRDEWWPLPEFPASTSVSPKVWSLTHFFQVAFW